MKSESLLSTIALLFSSNRKAKVQKKINFFLIFFVFCVFCVLVIQCCTQKIADSMKNLYVEVVPYQRDAKNGGKRDKNLGNVNFLHVDLLQVEIFNPSVLNLLAVACDSTLTGSGLGAGSGPGTGGFFLLNTALTSTFVINTYQSNDNAANHKPLRCAEAAIFFSTFCSRGLLMGRGGGLRLVAV